MSRRPYKELGIGLITGAAMLAAPAAEAQVGTYSGNSSGIGARSSGSLYYPGYRLRYNNIAGSRAAYIPYNNSSPYGYNSGYGSGYGYSGGYGINPRYYPGQGIVYW